ncbi:uncharacterized protein LOC124197226 isoform X1 [Daphnia pulex]|uniref:uncharacterized protein LOC124197226 isoform X1 n=2 Tax=Daphnia pulex TaxID=6669 RepID=UPI001EDFA75E|nr:uncharacterized protein LOC124197226 isoform X1 [Daphnia pulex]
MAAGISYHIHACFILCATLCICQTDAIDLEGHLQQLRDNYEILAAILNLLETLERKVEQQESELSELKTEQHRIRTAESFQRRILPDVGMERHRQSIGTGGAILRSCSHIRAALPSQTSGMHWIDPDGQGVGDDPIYVYCNMTTGSTAILHDSESRISVSHCTEPGCYSRVIQYSATTKQMSALAQLSDECHQSIRYDCTSAPFEINGNIYSWWNDRHGKPQYFWSGNRASVHTCQCGIEYNCIEALADCNCDSSLPTPLADIGVITDKNLLPITRLNFGRTVLENSSGMHTLGRFECTGQVAVQGMPSSCQDLWLIGHTLSGLYSVMGAAIVENVYCNFTKLPNDPGFQKSLGFGFADIKSSPTYFYVQKNTTFSATGIPMPFEVNKVNVGGAMDLTTGIFTSPRPGRCFFSFTGLAQFPFASPYKLRLGVGIYLNGYLNGRGWVANTARNQWSQFTLQSTLNLNAGDRVWLQITDMSDGVYLYDSNSHYTHFTGWLLEEETFDSH